MTLVQRLKYSGEIQERFGFILMLDALGLSHEPHPKQREWLHNRDQMLRHLALEQEWHLNYTKSMLQAAQCAAIPKEILTEWQHSIEIYSSLQENSDIASFGDTLILHSWLPDALAKPQQGIDIISGLALSFHEIMKANIIFGLRLRGAFSVGKYIISEDGNTILGDALLKAYKWYEAVDWMGIVFAPDLAVQYMDEIVAAYHTIKPEQIPMLMAHDWWEYGLSYRQISAAFILQFVSQENVKLKSDSQGGNRIWKEELMWTPTWPRTIHLDKITSLTALQITSQKYDYAKACMQNLVKMRDTYPPEYHPKYDNTIAFFEKTWDAIKNSSGKI